MGDVKTYPRQKKEPEMLNDFGPAGGYDCLYPGQPGEVKGNKDITKIKKEKMLGEYAGDILNPNEEKE